MTRVNVQNLEITGTTGDVFVRDTVSVTGGAWAAPAGVSDGDKGDVTVSGGGTVWTLDLTLDAINAPVASVGFAQQQATQLRIENRTSDPGSPAVGEIWLRTDL